MKKILFIHHATGWGGAPINLIENICALDKTEYKPFVLLLKDSIVSKKLEENKISYVVAKSDFYKKYYRYISHSEASYIKWFELFKYLKLSILWILSNKYFAKKELRELDFDIAQVNSSVLIDFLKPCSLKGKVIIHIQEPFRKGHFDFIYWVFRNQIKKYADNIIAISQDNANRINLPDKTTVIYNYANIPDNPPNVESFYSKKFLYLGGAAKIKGFYTLVKALDYLSIGTTIYFGGSYESPKQRGKLKSAIKRLLRYGKKKEEAIYKMRNHRNAIEIGLTYNVSDYLDEVCCLISPFSKPHFSRPVIEAHLHGKPAIGSDVEGMDEIILNGENGLIFKTDNAIELAKAINYVASNPEKAMQMGQNGFKIAKMKFTRMNVKMFESIYNNL